MARTRVDEALNKLEKALVGFNPPESMTRGQHLEIKAILTHELSREELTVLVRESARPPDSVTIAELRTSDLMIASLSSDDGIAIDPRGPQKQWVSLREPTEWRWRITALKEGEHRLILEFFALLSIAGELSPRQIRTLSTTIRVQVEPTRFRHLLASIGGPFALVAVVGLMLLGSTIIYIVVSRQRGLFLWYVTSRIAPKSPSQSTDPKPVTPDNLDSFISSANAETHSTDFIHWAGGERVTLAIVFTDIVGSTAIGEAVKDEHMNEIRRTHFARSREFIAQFEGREIKTIGDSFMAAFRNAADALDYARALYRDTGAHEVKIRAGIHIGPMSVEEGDVFGRTVNLAARVVSAIQGSEIWVSDQVKADIEALGSRRHRTLEWCKYNGITLKGFDGTLTLWSISHESLNNEA